MFLLANVLFHSMQIIYMDHIDILAGLPNEHAIDYSVPRIRFVCQKDFDWLDKVDKNKLTLVQPFYGKHTQVILLHPAYVFSFANGVLTPPCFLLTEFACSNLCFSN